MIYRHFLIFLFSVSLLSGCSLFSPVKYEPVKQYVLNTAAHPVIKKSRRNISLLVTPVQADPIYNTVEMAYTNCPYQIAYFSVNRWATTPSQMLQPLIVQTLQNTHSFRSVNTTPVIGEYDYALNTHLLELRQVFHCNMSEIHLVVRAQLINSSSNRVVATKQFTIIERTPQNTPYGGVIAANRAVERMLNQLAVFCVRSV